MDREEAVLALTAELVESRLRSGALFTTLDISNGLKRRQYPVRHGEVAEAVRSLYAAGAFGRFAYDRALIDVNTDNGATVTSAYVYLPQNRLPSDYSGRIQDALPPVSDDVARDLASSAAAVVSSLLNPTARHKRSAGRRSKVRRDGALPVPRRLVRQAGWDVNDAVELHLIHASAGGPREVVLAPPNTATAAGAVVVRVRVWNDLRVRVCRTALSRASDGQPWPPLHLPLPAQSWTVQGSSIHAAI
jgi:hypothetical protein